MRFPTLLEIHLAAHWTMFFKAVQVSLVAVVLAAALVATVRAQRTS